jgi:hypothetical protein
MKNAGFISVHTHDRNEDKDILNNISNKAQYNNFLLQKRYTIILVFHTLQA